MHPAVQAGGEVLPCRDEWHYAISEDGRCVAHKRLDPCDNCRTIRFWAGIQL